MSYVVEKREGKTNTSYRVQIIIKQDARILHREARSFPNYRHGDSSSARRNEVPTRALDDPDAFAELVHKGPSVTLGRVGPPIPEGVLGLLRPGTVGKDLDLLERAPLARIPVGRLKSGDIVAHTERRVEGYKRPHGTPRRDR